MTAPKLILRATRDPSTIEGWLFAERDGYFIETVDMRASDVGDAEAAIDDEERERLITEAIEKAKGTP